MFKVPRANVIECDEGFFVEVLGRTGILYTEGYKVMEIDSEILAGPSGLVIYRDSIKSWLTPYHNEPIGEHKRDTIVENIRRAFHFRGIVIETL